MFKKLLKMDQWIDCYLLKILKELIFRLVEDSTNSLLILFHSLSIHIRLFHIELTETTQIQYVTWNINKDLITSQMYTWIYLHCEKETRKFAKIRRLIVHYSCSFVYKQWIFTDSCRSSNIYIFNSTHFLIM